MVTEKDLIPHALDAGLPSERALCFLPLLCLTSLYLLLLVHPRARLPRSLLHPAETEPFSSSLSDRRKIGTPGSVRCGYLGWVDPLAAPPKQALLVPTRIGLCLLVSCAPLVSVHHDVGEGRRDVPESYLHPGVCRYHRTWSSIHCRLGWVRKTPGWKSFFVLP